MAVETLEEWAARLEEAVRTAPHADDCRGIHLKRSGFNYRRRINKKRCDCFKSVLYTKDVRSA